MTEALVDRGVDVVGYDPDPASISRCLDRHSRATYGGRELLERLLAEGARFDTVVCGRVLCTIANELEIKEALSDLRRLVADSGALLVSVCNPFHLSTEWGERGVDWLRIGLGGSQAVRALHLRDLRPQRGPGQVQALH